MVAVTELRWTREGLIVPFHHTRSSPPPKRRESSLPVGLDGIFRVHAASTAKER